MSKGLAVTLLVVVGFHVSLAAASPSVVVTPASDADTLVLDGMGSSSIHIVKIAELTLSTDASNGFTVWISSGSLTKADGRSPISFKVVLTPPGSGAPSASSFTTSSGSTYQMSTTAAGSVARDLCIAYTPAPLQDPGDYAAAVDISITDN
jgi:hypothetical protein